MNASAPSVTVTLNQEPSFAPIAIAAQVDETRPARVSAFDLLAGQAWAILPHMLDTMATIARRENEPVETLQARLGRPLQNTRSVTVRDGVAIVPVVGPIFRFANLFTEISGATSLDALAQDITCALDDPAIKAVVLEMNTPGGQAQGISDLGALIRTASKPVVAFAEQAASAGYWIAASAHEVVVGETGEVGSVGAVLTIDTRKRDGVMEVVSSQSPRKRPDATTDEGRAQVQAYVDRWAQAFIEGVAEARGVDTETVLSRFGQGGMLMGRDAVAAGMADRVATLEDVIAGLAGKSTSKGVHMADANARPEAQKPAIDREYLAANHPDLVAALRTDGATAERERILGVQAQGAKLPGHAALIARLVDDGKSTAADAALALVEAEHATAERRREAIGADRLQPVDFAAAPSASADAGLDQSAQASADANLPVEQRCEKAWNADPDLRSEFGTLGAYVAYTKAIESGRARVLGKK